MKIALDVSPLEKDGSFLNHRVRGVGFYLENLQKSLVNYYPDLSVQYFTIGEELKKNVSLVHFPYFDPFFFTYTFPQPVPTVITIHDLTPLVFPHAFPPGVRGRVRWLLQKRKLRHIAGIITDSEASKKDIVRIVGLPKEKVHVVYLAAGETFRHQALKKEQIEVITQKYRLPEKFTLYVGDVTWNKNVPRIIRATVQAEVPLVLVGKTLADPSYDNKNPWNSDLGVAKDLIQKHPTVQAIGFVSNEDLISLYSMATCFVMPSLYEGFGLPILEAMACGTPVITSMEGSLSEVAGDAAYIVDAYSEDSIAKGIRDVWEHPAIQATLREKGLSQSQKFTWRKTVRETVSIYEKIVGKDNE